MKKEKKTKKKREMSKLSFLPVMKAEFIKMGEKIQKILQAQLIG